MFHAAWFFPLPSFSSVQIRYRFATVLRLLFLVLMFHLDLRLFGPTCFDVGHQLVVLIRKKHANQIVLTENISAPGHTTTLLRFFQTKRRY